MTELLSHTDKELTVVEGSSVFCEGLRHRFPTIRVVRASFEDFEPAAPADLLDRDAGLGLPQKANDLLIGKFALLHVRHSPG